MSDERIQAREIANQWLDMRMNPLTQMVQGDPDCDAVVLARQYMRALEKIEQLNDLIVRMVMSQAELLGSVQAAVKDKWPRAVE